MKRAYYESKYGKPYEQYCREKYPDQADTICAKAEALYREFWQMTCPTWAKI